MILMAKIIEFDGKTIRIKTKQKTITIDEDHAYFIKRLGINASQMLRDCIEDRISKESDGIVILNDFYREKVQQDGS